MAVLVKPGQRMMRVTADPGNTAPVSIEQDGKEPIMLEPGRWVELDRNDGDVMARSDGVNLVRVVEV